jgi:hypothetical protein
MHESPKKIFIDESGVHEGPENIWTYCCIIGTEQEIEKCYNSLICDLQTKCSKIIKMLKREKELKYSKVNGINKDTVINLLAKYKIDFLIVYSDSKIVNYIGTIEKKERDNLRRQMALMAIMESEAIFGKTDFVVFDKLPFSKSNWNKINKTLNEKFNQKTNISCVNSKLKKGLQFADLIAGASRNFLKNKRHEIFFQNSSERFYSFQKSHEKLKLIYSKELTKKDMCYCFHWNN